MRAAAPLQQPATAPPDSLVALAYQHLKEQLLGCRIAPGALVTATELADRLEISRTPVNQAFKLLSQEGFLLLRPGKGYLVTGLSPSDLEDVFQLRLHNEPWGAALAAEHARPQEVAAVKAQHERDREGLASDPPQGLAYQEYVISANERFHVTVAALSGNQRLKRTIRWLLEGTRRTYFLKLYASRVAASQEDPHREILRAIEARDPDAAHAAMVIHLRDTHEGTLLADKKTE